MNDIIIFSIAMSTVSFYDIMVLKYDLMSFSVTITI
jgi:hypothetical protein